jgi:hypothetical protein
MKINLIRIFIKSKTTYTKTSKTIVAVGLNTFRKISFGKGKFTLPT